MSKPIIPTHIRRLAAVGVVVLAVTALTASHTSADHGLAHNGETLELSKTSGITDGETITLTMTNFLPGASITVVTCYNFPAAGPADCELSNYGQYTGTAADDGTASVDYLVSVIPGRCDHENACYVVASDGIGPNANHTGVQITFAGAEGDDAMEPAADDDDAMEPAADDAMEPVADNATG